MSSCLDNSVSSPTCGAASTAARRNATRTCPPTSRAFNAGSRQRRWPSTATSSHSVAPLAVSAKIPVHSPSRSPSWSTTSRPCQPLATSRSGNVTALSLLHPGADCVPRVPPHYPQSQQQHPSRPVTTMLPQSVGRRSADRSTDGRQRSRNLHTVTTPALSSPPAATSRCTQPVPWARVAAVGVAPSTGVRSRKDNGGSGGVVAVVVVAGSRPEPTSSPTAREPAVL